MDNLNYRHFQKIPCRIGFLSTTFRRLCVHQQFDWSMSIVNKYSHHTALTSGTFSFQPLVYRPNFVPHRTTK